MTTDLAKRALVTALAALTAVQPACSGSSPSVSNVAQAGESPFPTPKLPGYPERSVVTTKIPIKLGGGGGVSDTGAAMYDLPLHVPEGPRGLQPQLSLVYRGGGGNGHLGSGFALAGLSTIAPCGKRFASEGIADGVDYGADDSYCLDGQKLVPFADPNHPDSTSERVFHTEVESFARILAKHDTAHVQPSSFVVHGRDGLVHTYRPRFAPLHYGISDRESGVESKLLVAYVYLLEKSVDPSGNWIDYTYEGTDATGTEVAYRIAMISYSQGRRLIKFRYSSRPDPYVRYQRGVKLVNRSVLVAIEAQAPNPNITEPVWTYQLGYTTSSDTGDSLLRSVRLCAQLGACSYARRFDWTIIDDKPAEGFNISTTTEFDDFAMSRSEDHLDAYFGPPNMNWVPSNDVRVLLFDVDSDGDDDALYRTRPTSVVFNVNGDEYVSDVSVDCAMGKLWLRRTTSGPLSTLTNVSQNLELDSGSYNQHGCPGSSFESPFAGLQIVSLGKSRVGDFDGDGKAELQVAKVRVDPYEEVKPDGTVHAGKWTLGYQTSAWDPNDEWKFPNDPLPTGDIAMFGPAIVAPMSWDGDYGYYNPGLAERLLLTSPPFQRVFADVDGDGRDEPIDAVSNINILDYPDVDWSDRYSFHTDDHAYATMLSSSSTAIDLHQRWGCGNGRARVVDLHGNGRDNVLVAKDTVNSGEYSGLGLSDASGTSPPHGQPMLETTSKLWAGDCGPELENNPDLTMGDWNGDGLVDALYPPGSHNNNSEALVRWNLGNGFGPFEVMPVHSPQPNVSAADLGQDAPIGRDHNPVAWDRGTRTADVNNDGRTDIIAFRQDNTVCVDIPLAAAEANQAYDFQCENRLMVFISNGTSFKATQEAASLQGANLANGFTTSQIGDVDGDGAIDAVWVNGGRLQLIKLPWRWTPDRLAAVHDDSTPFAIEELEYTRSWWGTATRPSQREGGCPYPLACVYRGASVVRQHRVFAGTRSDGSPMTRTYLHQYRGFYADQRGRGGLGVSEHRIWDRETGVETKRYFKNDDWLPSLAGKPGGEFYPGAFTPSKVVTITPISPLPTIAQLADPTFAPGLGTTVQARIARTTYERELRRASDGRILTVLASASRTAAGDGTVTLDPQAELPSYGDAALPEAHAATQTTTTYDDRGNPLEVVSATTGGVTRRQTFTYADDLVNWRLGLATKVTQESHDANDGGSPIRITETSFDNLGRPAKIDTHAVGTSDQEATHVELAYDSFGNVNLTTTTAFDVVEPRVVATTYDAEGVYASATTDPYGAVDIVLHHPALGVPIYTDDANGVEGMATYDPFGRMVAAAREGTAAVTQTYSEYIAGNRRGVRVEFARADGRKLYRQSDELGRVTATGDFLETGTWAHRRNYFDPIGNLVVSGRPSSSDTPSTPTTTVYDRLGRVTTITRGDGAVTAIKHPALDQGAITAARFETLRTDPEGHRTFITRDLDGRIIRAGHRIGADYGTIVNEYGPFDQLERVTDAESNVTTHRFDALGRRVELVDPDTGTTQFGYNGFGELVSQTDAGGVTVAMEYDRLGRLVLKTGPDGTYTRTFGTTGVSARQEIQAVSPDGVDVTTEYDTLGRIRAVRQTVNGVSDIVEQAYDSYGRLKLRWYPAASGYRRFTTHTVWGTAGLAKSIENVTDCLITPTNPTVPEACLRPVLWDAIERNADGVVTNAKLGPNIVDKRAFNSTTGLLGSIRVDFNGNTVASLGYKYDRDDVMTERTHEDRVETFDHDELHRLVEWEVMDGRKEQINNTGYTYDPLGNLLNVKLNSTLVWDGTYGSRPHVLDRIERPGQPTLLNFYDLQGRQTIAGSRTTAWTQDDQPRTIDAGQGTVQHYTYGTTNQRVVAQSGDEEVTYVGKLYERHRTSEGTRHVFLVPGETGTVAQMTYTGDQTQVRYLVNDGLGNASLVLDDGVGVIERSYFAPFGGRVDVFGAPTVDPDRTTSIGFTGHEEDRDQIIHMNGRLYDIAQYRFTAPDPVIGRPLFGQNHNPYNYVFNSPLAFTDPSGFDPPDYGPGGDGGGTGNGGGFDGSGYVDRGDDAAGGADGGPTCDENGVCEPNGSTGGGGGAGGHADEPTYQPPSSYSQFIFWTGYPPPASTGTSPAAPLIDVKNFKPCYRPGKEPPREKPWWEGSVSNWGFSSGESAADQFRSWVNRGWGQRMAETHATGLSMWAEAEFAMTRMGIMLLAAELGGADPRYTGAAAILTAHPKMTGGRVMGPRWTRQPTLADRGEVYGRQHGRCWGCGEHMTRKKGPRQMQLDHPNDFSTHGKIDPLDSIGLCATCNKTKSNVPLSWWAFIVGARNTDDYLKNGPWSY
jgi:RHS repeat-associated protein